MINHFKCLFFSSLAIIPFWFYSYSIYGPVCKTSVFISLIFVINVFFLFIKERRIDHLFFFPIIFQTWNYFLRPYLTTEPIFSRYRVIPLEYIDKMATFAMLAVICIYIGYYWFQKKKIQPFFSPKKFTIIEIRRFIYICIAYFFCYPIINEFLKFIGLRLSFLGMIQMMLPSLIFSLFVLFFLRKGRSVFLSILVFAILIMSFLSALGGTLFMHLILLVFGPFLIYFMEKKTIPYIPFLLVALFLLPIYLNRHNYRSEGLLANEKQKRQIGLTILTDVYSNLLVGNTSKLLNEKESDIQEEDRFEGVSYLGHVVDKHENWNWSFKLGETLIWIPTLILPHFLIPFRPNMNLGVDLAIEYGLNFREWNCSMNWPMLVEFYVNFGWIGILFLSIIQGWAYFLIFKKLNFANGDLNFLLFLLVFMRLIIVEGNVALIFGLPIQIFFCICIYKRFFLKKNISI